jgi:hypothetical protein
VESEFSGKSQNDKFSQIMKDYETPLFSGCKKEHKKEWHRQAFKCKKEHKKNVTDKHLKAIKDALSAWMKLVVHG